MKGNNTLHLNQATMIDAVQLLMNSKFRDGEAPKVTSVKLSSHGYPSGGNSASGVFEVEVVTEDKI